MMISATSYRQSVITNDFPMISRSQVRHGICYPRKLRTFLSRNAPSSYPLSNPTPHHLLPTPCPSSIVALVKPIMPMQPMLRPWIPLRLQMIWTLPVMMTLRKLLGTCPHLVQPQGHPSSHAFPWYDHCCSSPSV